MITNAITNCFNCITITFVMLVVVVVVVGGGVAVVVVVADTFSLLVAGSSRSLIPVF